MFTKIKIANTKLKELGKDLTKKFNRDKEFKNYSNNNVINLLIFYTGDVNFDFNNGNLFENDKVTIYDKEYNIRIMSYFISKMSLFDHFAKTNRLNIE